MKELQNKVCLVTGGSRGIGRAIVNAMADDGADVAFTYQHSQDQALALENAVRQKGVRCRSYKADVASGEEMSAVVKQVIADMDFQVTKKDLGVRFLCPAVSWGAHRSSFP